MITIIDAWREMTTYKDCCKGKPYGEDTDEIKCRAVPSLALPLKHQRCDSGMWLFKGDYSGRNYFPMDLWNYLRLCADTGSDLGIGVVPRENWPEAPHA